MKKRLLLSLLTAVLLVCLLAACKMNNGPSVITDPPTGTTADAPTDTPTEAPEQPTGRPTEAPTTASGDPIDTPTEAPGTTPGEVSSEAPTDAETDVTTEAPTEAATDPGQEADPYETPVKVGVSYDGKTPCYDGRLYHEYETFKSSAANGIISEFDSLQDAIDSLEGVGGSVSCANYGDLGLCLSANFPKDGCSYHLYYNYNNCDFVFNYGYTYDDGAGGYAYYSDMSELDKRSDLGETYLYVWGDEGVMPEGYYMLHWVGGGKAAGGRNYEYEKLGEVSKYWKGLFDGETYFE